MSLMALGQVGTCLRGTAVWKEAGSSQSLGASGGVSPACPLGLLGALAGWLWSREQLGSCTLSGVFSGFWGAVGKAGDPSSACSCCPLQVHVGQEIQGPLAGLASLGEEEQARLCLKEVLVGEAPDCGRAVCAPGPSCHATALSCCSLTVEFAILSFLAVPPQKCWARAGKAANRVAWGFVTVPGVSPIPCLAVSQFVDVGAGEQV